MVIKLDRFLIAELNDKGFDLTYSSLHEIYKASRLRLDCLRATRKRENEKAYLNSLSDEFTALVSELESKKS